MRMKKRAMKSRARHDEACGDQDDSSHIQEQSEDKEDLPDRVQTIESMGCHGQQEGNACSGQWQSEPCPSEAGIKILAVFWRTFDGCLTARDVS